MALQKFRRPYEVLIRYVKGQPSAIQLICEEGIIEDDVVIQRSETMAEEVELENFALSQLISETTTQALLLIDSLSAKLAELEETLGRQVALIENQGAIILAQQNRIAELEAPADDKPADV